jgi:hypothetical protein
VRLATGFVAAGYVGQHQCAAVRQAAVVVADRAGGAAARVAGDLGVWCQRADQAGLAGGDFAEQRDIDARAGAAAVEFAEFGRQRAGVGAAFAQLADALFQAAAIGHRRWPALAARAQQPPQHAQAGRGEGQQHSAKCPLQPRRQIQETLRQRQRAFGGGEQQPQQRGHG